jgi:mycothiol synthase
LAGYLEFWDLMKPRVLMQTWLRIHPDYPVAEIAPVLLEWGEEKARQHLPTVPEGTRVALRIGAHVKDVAQVKALENADYQNIRRFWRMHIDFNGATPAPTWPEGIRVRSMQPGEERKAIHAVRSAFHDHWGHVETPFEEEFSRWQHFMRTGDWFDPSLWFFALDGEEIAGFSYCRAALDGEPEVGWVNQLGVLRPWRNRGLGLALLQHSLAALQSRGRPSVALGVDASSLTGATRLYRKAGMHPDERYTIDLFEKEMRPGEDLTTH